MDHFSWREIAGLAFVVCALAVLSFPRGARAATAPYPVPHTSQEAYENCMADSSRLAVNGTCITRNLPGYAFAWQILFEGDRTTYCGQFFCQGNPYTGTECLALPGASGAAPVGSGGKVCYKGCGFAPSGSSVTVGAGGVTSTYGDWKPDGTTCTVGAPPVAPPKVCNGVSCFNPNTNQYCAVTGSGNEVCVTGGGPGGVPAPACATGDGVALCAGAPAPTPPNPPISDPPTDIAGTDRITQQNGTGPINNVTTNIYNAGSGSTSNGAGTGDVGKGAMTTPGTQAPAGSSSTSGGGSFGGGAGCDTPPACTGDAVLCGIARTQWATTCQVHKDLAGTGPAPAGTVFGKGDVWVSGSGSDTSVGGQANQGIYNEVGFGAPSACPLVDKVVPLWGSSSFTIPFSVGCTPLGWLRYLIIGFALFAAAKITMGASN